MPDYIHSMVIRLFLERKEKDFTWINKDQTVDILFKIALLSEEQPDFKRGLLKFLVKHCDRKKDLYYQIC